MATPLALREGPKPDTITNPSLSPPGPTSTSGRSVTCLVRFDNNRYSVSASAVGRPVDIHAYADRIVIRQNGRIVGEHQRRFGRNQTAYDPWHYVPALARKPGALRNGAPFKDWVLSAALDRTSGSRIALDGCALGAPDAAPGRP